MIEQTPVFFITRYGPVTNLEPQCSVYTWYELIMRSRRWTFRGCTNDQAADGGGSPVWIVASDTDGFRVRRLAWFVGARILLALPGEAAKRRRLTN